MLDRKLVAQLAHCLAEIDSGREPEPLLAASAGRRAELRRCLGLSDRLASMRAPQPSAEGERRWRRLLTIQVAEQRERRLRMRTGPPVRRAFDFAVALATAVLLLTAVLGASASLGHGELLDGLISRLAAVRPDAGEPAADPKSAQSRGGDDADRTAAPARAGGAVKVVHTGRDVPAAAPVAASSVPAVKVEARERDQAPKNEASAAMEHRAPASGESHPGKPPMKNGLPPYGHGPATPAAPPGVHGSHPSGTPGAPAGHPARSDRGGAPEPPPDEDSEPGGDVADGSREEQAPGHDDEEGSEAAAADHAECGERYDR